MMTRWTLIFLFSIPAWGYNLTPDFINGFYWAELPVRFIVSDDNPSRKAAILSLTKQAVSEWESKTRLSIWSLIESGTPNIIRWSSNFAAETKMDPNSVLAVTIRYTKGPYYARSEIVINGGHWLNQNEENLRTTLIHELGHTMGIDHSENAQAIMAPSFSGVRPLHSDDLAGMADAYQQTRNRQITGYVSPLATSTVTEETKPFSCGTLSVSTSMAPTASGLVSLCAGILISLVRKIALWLKSLL